ncbi:hypothetical protein M2267_003078 [Ensifer sp. KUDG1]|uniref:hypothetical protein n=1 Tax=Ensifer sp. KUDG1 TaxID=3373919 RepID=UPI003D1CAA69
MNQITKEAIEAAADAYWGRDVLHGSTALDQMRIALEAALPFLPIAVEGKVKALEWVEGAPGTYTEIAESPFGHYSVWEINGTACWSPWKAGSGSIVDGGLAGAKAAAQSDYQTRILSALDAGGE